MGDQADWIIEQGLDAIAQGDDNDTGPDRCRSCDAPIEWVVTTNRKKMPIDHKPRNDGNLVKSGFEGDGTPTVRYLKTGENPPGDKYVSHFATCPNAQTHRKE